MNQRLKHLSFGIICFIIFPIVVLVSFELGLKFLGVKSLHGKKFQAKSKREFLDDHSFYLLDKDLLWRLQPNTVKEVDGIEYKVNSHGLRSNDFELSKESGVFRIGVFGDSSTFGLNLPFDEIYHQYLMKMLESKYPQKKFEVINFGVPGYSSRQGVVVFHKWLDKIDPDLVIVSFGANDGYGIPAGVYGDMEIVGTSTTIAVNIRSHLERLRIVTLLHTFVTKIEEKALNEQKGKKIEVTKCRVPKEGYEKNIRKMAAIARKHDIPAVFLNISIADKYLDVLKKLSDKGEITFCDVETSLQELYYSEDRDEFIKKFTREQIKTPIFDEINEMCTKLLGEKQMAIRRDRILFTDDFHPNAPGNYVIAQTLFENVQELIQFFP